MIEAYSPDRSLRGKLRRRALRAISRRRAGPVPAGGLVSFSFDDVPASAAEAGAAVLEAAGLRGSFYVAGALRDRESRMGRFASADEVARLVRAGHEVGCHTHGHIDLAHTSTAEVEAELDANREALAASGAPVPSTFAYPYGELGLRAKRVAADRFSVARTVQAGLVRSGSDLAQAPAVGIEGEGGERAAGGWIARAAREGAWLILYTHDVQPRPSAWGCTPEALRRVVDRALAAGLRPVTVAEGGAMLGAAR